MSVILILLLVLLAVPLFALLLRKDNIIPVIELRDEMETKASFYFDYQTVRCHFTDEGSGDPIVLIHGLGDSHRIFDEFALQLKENYRVIRFDLPGFGLSDVPNLNQTEGELIDYYTSCFNAFVQEYDLVHFHLMGNSLGGWVSWHWAADHSDQLKTLSLLASAGFEMERVVKNITQGVLEYLPQFVLNKGMPKAVAKLNLQTCIYNKGKITPEHIENNYRMINKRGTLPFMFTLFGANAKPATKRLGEITCPTLIVWGDRDKIIPVSHAKKFQKAIKKSTMIVYPKCGHYPQIEFSKELINDWRNFAQKP